MELYIVRHGQTDGNLTGTMDGQRDIPINNNGVNQAHGAKEILKDVVFDLIICSPLTRTRQTMEIINVNDCPVIYEPRVIERDCGEFMGTKAEGLDRDLYWNYLDNTKYEKVENIKDFFKRIFDYLDYIKKEFHYDKILIVTHGGVSKAIDCYFNGIPEDGSTKGIGLNNCGIAKYII